MRRRCLCLPGRQAVGPGVRIEEANFSSIIPVTAGGNDIIIIVFIIVLPFWVDSDPVLTCQAVYRVGGVSKPA